MTHLSLFFSFFVENDPVLRRATILDGRLINFLFSNSVTKAVRGNSSVILSFHFLSLSS
jgi:hypothetical protein